MWVNDTKSKAESHRCHVLDKQHGQLCVPTDTHQTHAQRDETGAAWDKELQADFLFVFVFCFLFNSITGIQAGGGVPECSALQFYALCVPFGRKHGFGSLFPHPLTGGEIRSPCKHPARRELRVWSHLWKLCCWTFKDISFLKLQQILPRHFCTDGLFPVIHGPAGEAAPGRPSLSHIASAWEFSREAPVASSWAELRVTPTMPAWPIHAPPCLTALAGVFSTVLNRSGERGHFLTQSLILSFFVVWQLVSPETGSLSQHCCRSHTTSFLCSCQLRYLKRTSRAS